MFGRAITLFKMFGFSVRVDLSWIIIFVLVVWSLAAGVFPNEHMYPQYVKTNPGIYWVMAIVAALGLFASVVVHELCHSLVARRYGLEMSGITLFIFGGVAEMTDEPPSARAEFMMAIAGPASSAVIALLFAAAWFIARDLGSPPYVQGVLGWLGFINGTLVVFNLIPGFPLDGGRVLRSILWHFQHNLRSATRTASNVGLAFGTFLIALGILTLFTSGNLLGAVWWILIGWFVRNAASQGYQQVLIRQTLQGEPIRRFMNPTPVTVPSSLPLDRLVEDYIYHYHYKMFPVVDDGTLAGCITTRHLKEVHRERWPQHTVREFLEPCSGSNSISADADALAALTSMNKTKSSRLMVVDGPHLAGILSLKDLFKFLSLKLELEGEDLEHAAAPKTPTGSQ